MNHFLSQLKVPINENLFIKDPFSSELGKKVLHGAINLLDNSGFERFNFKKLASEIQTTEASIYRYFESKHKLLLYLINWYWGCVAMRLLFETKNLTSPELKLKKAIHVLTALPETDSSMSFVNENTLKKIVIHESAKAIHTKEVDVENNVGIYSVYKTVVNTVAEMIHEVNENYPYPNMLVSNMIEGSNQQRFFAEHLPKLTNSHVTFDNVEAFYQDLVFKTIQA